MNSAYFVTCWVFIPYPRRPVIHQNRRKPKQQFPAQGSGFKSLYKQIPKKLIKLK